MCLVRSVWMRGERCNEPLRTIGKNENVVLKVIDGCSDLFVEVLGETGKHARSAVGMGSLPNRMTVEIEAILLIKST